MSVLSRVDANEDKIRARIDVAKTTKILVPESWLYTEQELQSEEFKLVLAYVLENSPQTLIASIRTIAEDPRLEGYLSDDVNYEGSEQLRQELHDQYGVAFDFAELYIILSDYPLQDGGDE